MDGIVGEIRCFAGDFPPLNWEFCEGQLLNVNEYPELYSIILNTYGNDGAGLFALPDLRGRTIVGIGGISALDLGEKYGERESQLKEEHLTYHSHQATIRLNGDICGDITANMKVNGDESATKCPAGGYLGNTGFGCREYADQTTGDTLANDAITVDTGGLALDIEGGTVTVNNAGCEMPELINNMQPSLALNWIICVRGDYP